MHEEHAIRGFAATSRYFNDSQVAQLDQYCAMHELTLVSLIPPRNAMID